MDQVVFIDAGGVDGNWTLGADGDHDVLFEQHNPDYLAARQGGPAVLVADSENNRVVEYQRRNGAWERSWTRHDAAMSWPRDADRLPNGHTLIADSHGERVIEVDRQGEIVWQITGLSNYDVERLGTGDESTDGPAAVAGNLQSVTQTSPDPTLTSVLESAGKGLLPPKIHHAIQFVMPPWMSMWSVLAVAVTVPVVSVLLAGAVLERWGGVAGWSGRR